MRSDSESTDAGKPQSTGSESTEEAKKTGVKSPGIGLTNTLGETSEQRIGSAGELGPEKPEIVAKNVETTKAAYSSGSKPANKGQNATPAETETTDYGQTETKHGPTDTTGS